MNLRNKKSKEGARGHIIGLSNQSAFPEDKKSYRPIRLIWQDIEVRRANQSSFYGPSSVSNNHILWTDHPTDHLSASANHILWREHPMDHLSVSANQILRTDLPTNHLSVSSNQILRTDLPTDHLPYRPIRSFGRTFLRTIFPSQSLLRYIRTNMYTTKTYKNMDSHSYKHVHDENPYKNIC